MRCTTCDQAERLPVRRAQLAERDGRVAIILEVPMEECPSCGTRWLTSDIAVALDEALTAMLAANIVETSTAHWDVLAASAA